MWIWVINWKIWIENFLVSGNIWGLNSKSELIFKVKIVLIIFVRWYVEKYMGK